MAPAFVTLGEALVELMRDTVGVGLDVPGTFVGPFPSGAPAIAAASAARLGMPSGFIGCLGDDDFGHCFRARCARDGVDASWVVTVPGATTGTSFVTYLADGSRRFLFHLADAAAGRLGPEMVDAAYVGGARVIHITGSTLALGAGPHAACMRAARLGKAGGALISFDPNLRPELLGGRTVAEVCGPILELADVVLPSGAEAALLAGNAPQAPAEASCRALLARWGGKLVVLKQGAEGSTAYPAGGDPLHVPSFAVQEVDPTGAGDCFAAALLVGLERGMELCAALRRANAAGAMATTVRGPMEGTPTADELERFMAQYGEQP
jgi:sugar/nucleoside kinase (ribokinase family)